MVGRIIYRCEKGRERSFRENLFGLPVLNLFLFDLPGSSKKRLERRLEKIELTCYKERVKRVLLPERFPYTQRLSWLQPVSTVTFYRAVADVLVIKLLERKGISPPQSRVALSAPRACPELLHTARSLCRSVREIRIDIPGEEGERVAQELQRQFGVPVVPPDVPADVTLSFGGETGDLQLWEEKANLSGLRLRAHGMDIPDEVEQQVLALLWERGRLKRDELWVEDNG